ncbi:hypothetical protein H6F81_29195 [Anabaena cylindrica FACHB-318]|uniref:Uncharacterized protein n=1 Tax=Anabaena cylindrica FACHB-318 TaxID=2692880 RepID=A0ABR7ZR95_ANACY|nr:hypothetical protein [Anabaena cylindrica FACHB-318]
MSRRSLPVGRSIIACGLWNAIPKFVYLYDENPNSTELWSPGSPLFPIVEGVD